MLFKCNRGPEANQDRLRWLKTWRPWFAWRPVPVGNGMCAWWQMVERRCPYAWCVNNGTIWDKQHIYRLPVGKSGEHG